MGKPTETKVADYRPPNAPWKQIKGSVESGSYLAFYYSDPYSDVPVRRISSETDSKSDPNIETGTFGLFSTCEVDMRSSILRESMKYIFFITRRRESRVLTGYYKVGWYTMGPAIKGYGSSGKEKSRDVILAAEEMKFVNPGFDLSELTGYLEGKDLSTRFRNFKKLDAKTTSKLLKLIDHTEDATRQYLEEINCLEKENIKKVGFAYPNWKRRNGFSWSDAGTYLGME